MFDPAKPPATLPELVHRAFSQNETKPCLGVKNRTTAQYEYSNYGEIAARVRNIACGLLHLGLERGQRAAILAESRPEWAIADLACQMIGVISVPLFSTLPAAQVKGILLDSGASLVFASTKSQFKKLVEIAAELPDLKRVVIMDEIEEAPTVPHLLHWKQLEEDGKTFDEQNPSVYETSWPAAASGDIATIIYTSGTTGEPKGAALTHRNICSNVHDLKVALQEAYGDLGDEAFLSFLPLAHVYERTAGFYLPLRLGASIAYCESLFTVDKNLKEAKPTLMLCVPRLLESVRDKLLAAAKNLPEGQQDKYSDAIKLAQKRGAWDGNQAGAESLSLIEKLKLKLYDGAVYSKVRAGFGGRLRAFVSGGAALPPDVGALFLGLGITVLEGYGLTETSPVIAVNRPRRVRLGTVGEPLPSCEVKIASDGEIVVRGATIMQGYWNKPEATREAIQDGWFHTGDIGVLENNILRVTDRKKDLLVLANGKKVAPAPIEMALSQSPLIAQAVLLGDGQKGVAALVVPEIKALREYSKRESWSEKEVSDEELIRLPQAENLVRRECEQLTPHLADFEKIKRIILLSTPFSVEGGELTPTLKVKRKVVTEKYSSQLSI